ELPAVNVFPSSMKVIGLNVAEKMAEEKSEVSGNCTGVVSLRPPGAMSPKATVLEWPPVSVSLRELLRNVSEPTAAKSGGRAKPPVRFEISKTLTPAVAPAGINVSKEIVPRLTVSAEEVTGTSMTAATTSAIHGPRLIRFIPFLRLANLLLDPF